MFSFLANRQLRRLCVPLLFTEFLWGMGTFFTLPVTTLPSYFQSLHASPVLVGLMATAMGTLMVLPQFFGRSVIERFRHRKRGIIWLHGYVIAAYFLIPLLDLALRERSAASLVWLAIALLGVSQLVIGVIVPVWLDMVARIIPIEIRGTYFGVASAVFSLGGILGGAALTLMKGGLGDVLVFRGAFLTSGVCFVLSMTAFACAPVPESAFEHDPEPSIMGRIRKSFAACHPRTSLGRFLISYVLFTLALGFNYFVVDYVSDPLGLGKAGLFGLITFLEAIGGAISAMVLGVMVDRLGPRWPWVITILALPAVLLLLPHGGALPALIACALLLGVFNTIWVITGPAMLELSPDGDKSGYVAMVYFASFPAIAAGPLLMGWVREHYGFTPTFLLAGAFAVIALLAALTLRPRATLTPAAHSVPTD